MRKVLFLLIFGLIFLFAGFYFSKNFNPNISQQKIKSVVPIPITSLPISSNSAILGEKPAIQKFKVLKVVDGDTIDVEINNQKEAVRLIGIDAPEISNLKNEIQCFSEEASQRAKELLEGKFIFLGSDVTQGERDKYNRLLRYIFLEDSTNFNQLMISGGYAYEYTYKTPYKYQSEFKKAEKIARDNKKGLWAACQN